MSEYKYRGKCNDKHSTKFGQWIFGGVCDYESGICIFEVSHYGGLFEPPHTELDEYDVDRETVGQFIGICDKNEREVYEGDIVKTKFGRICKVVWFSSDSDKCFDLRPINILYDENKAPDRYDLWKSENIEVIGNIHDNPELLEVNKIQGQRQVNFYDYDGTLVASYTAEEFMKLSEMPANPSHAGLVAEGWNWKLEEAKAFVASYGSIDIGQNYHAEEGKSNYPTPKKQEAEK